MSCAYDAGKNVHTARKDTWEKWECWKAH